MFIIVAWGISEATANWRHREVVRSASAAAVLLACLLSTWGQAAYWWNSETLFIQPSGINSNNYMAYHQLSVAFTNEGKLDQAAAMYHKSIEVDPSLLPRPITTWRSSTRDRAGLPRRSALFKTAIRLTPNSARFYHNLALAYQQQGKIPEAEVVRAQVRWLSRGGRVKPIDLF